jgi:hypothetical protein
VHGMQMFVRVSRQGQDGKRVERRTSTEEGHPREMIEVVLVCDEIAPARYTRVSPGIARE